MSHQVYMKTLYILLILLTIPLRIHGNSLTNVTYQDFLKNSYPVYVYCGYPVEEGYRALYEIVFRPHKENKAVLFGRVNYGVGFYQFVGDASKNPHTYINPISSGLDVVDPKDSNLRLLKVKKIDGKTLSLAFDFNHELPLKSTINPNPVKAAKSVAGILTFKLDGPITFKIQDKNSEDFVDRFFCSPLNDNKTRIDTRFYQFIQDKLSK